MSRKPKARARKVKSSGVWIAPDLERKIKGEGGRRGLTEPPYSYYLHLADIALRTPSSPAAGARSAKAEDEDSSVLLKGSYDIPAAELPISVPPKPPKFAFPKPPKTPPAPKPAKRAPSKPLQRPTPKKLAFRKPPKRGR